MRRTVCYPVLYIYPTQPLLLIILVSKCTLCNADHLADDCWYRANDNVSYMLQDLYGHLTNTLLTGIQRDGVRAQPILKTRCKTSAVF